MFFAEPGKYEACGLFVTNHFKLIIITILCIIITLKSTINKSKQEVYKIIKNMTITVWILEIIKISFSLKYNNLKNVNTYLPLYYCSLLLYAGLFSSFAKGKLKRIGDVFLATGAIIGGVVFIILPTTSLLTYPALHFLSIHSFFYHGTMIYLGILVNKTNYIELEKKDIIYFACLVGGVCIVAYIINNIFDSNLMFISQNFPGTPVEAIYNFTGKAFSIIMCICQMTLPFYIVYGILKIQKVLVRKFKKENKEIILKEITEECEEKEECYLLKK